MQSKIVFTLIQLEFFIDYVLFQTEITLGLAAFALRYIQQENNITALPLLYYA